MPYFIPFARLRLHQLSAFLGFLSVIGLLQLSSATVAVAVEPGTDDVLIPVGHTVAVPLGDVTIRWPKEPVDFKDAVSDLELVTITRVEALNNAPHIFVTGKRIGTASLSATYETSGTNAAQSHVTRTVHVTQDADRVRKILDAYNTPHGTQLTARLYGTGERLVIEGVALSRAQLMAIVRQLPNDDLAKEHIVLNVKYKCHCRWCAYGIGTPHAQ